MNKNLRFLLGVAIIAVAFSLPYFKGSVGPSPDSVAKKLKLEKPVAELVTKNSPIYKIVTDQKDREKLSVFFYVFSERLPKYETNVQKIDSIFTSAGKEVFDGNMRGKYKDLSPFITTTMTESLGDRDGLATKDERKKLSNNFNAISWILSEGTN